MLAEARSAVQGIKKAHLDEVRAMASPPAAVKLTLEAVVYVLGHATTNWKDIRRALAKTDFIATVVNFKTSQVTGKMVKKIKSSYMSQDAFKCVPCASVLSPMCRVTHPLSCVCVSRSYETVNRASKTAAPLFKWLVSQVSYAEILERVQPMRDEVAALQEQSESLSRQYQEQTKLTEELQASITRYKDEYAVLIREAEAIKTEMSSVQERVSRSTKLLASLSDERRRWESGSGHFREHMRTIAGDTLLAAAFLTYSGRFDFKQRRVMTDELRIMLDTVAAPYRQDLSLVEYLSKASDRLAWQAASLPADDLCVKNAIILSRFNRFPLVIDPAGQATEYLRRHYGREREVSVTSFLDASFMKHLESALRFGMTLLVQDVDSIDPVLNPVLNREFHKAGGRVLVQLGGHDVDLSPSFTMFMVTRDPTCRFTPDLCSRVTFVNFTITPSSLQSQCLSKVLKSERPDVDEKRTNLLRMQGEYQARIRDLEERLLNELSGIEGNILDDDSIMVSLETLKKDASEVAEQVANTAQIMASVDSVTTFYQPFAVAASRMYFTLERMPDVHFLYQTSLATFLDTVDGVLGSSTGSGSGAGAGAGAGAGGSAAAGAGTGTEARLRELTSQLFSSVYSRVSRGLLNQHRIVLGLQLAYICTQTPLGKAQPSAALPEAELDWLLRAVAPLQPDAALTTLVEDTFPGLEPLQQRLFVSLLSLASGPWRALADEVRSNGDAWRGVLSATSYSGNADGDSDDEDGDASKDAALVGVEMPTGWELDPAEATLPPTAKSWLAAWRRLLVVRALRPDQVQASATAFVEQALGRGFLDPRGDDAGLKQVRGGWHVSVVVCAALNVGVPLLPQLVDSTPCNSPLLLCSEPGFDASSRVDALAAEVRHPFSSVSMGSPEGCVCVAYSLWLAALCG